MEYLWVSQSIRDIQMCTTVGVVETDFMNIYRMIDVTD